MAARRRRDIHGLVFETLRIISMQQSHVIEYASAVSYCVVRIAAGECQSRTLQRPKDKTVSTL